MPPVPVRALPTVENELEPYDWPRTATLTPVWRLATTPESVIALPETACTVDAVSVSAEIVVNVTSLPYDVPPLFDATSR